MLTKSDLKLIKAMFGEQESKTNEKFSRVDEKFSRVDEKFKMLENTLIEFKDAILGEIKSLREDIAIVTGYRDMIEDHETRIEKLEQKNRIS